MSVNVLVVGDVLEICVVMILLGDEVLVVVGDGINVVWDVVVFVVIVFGEIFVKVLLYEILGECCWYFIVICFVKFVVNN